MYTRNRISSLKHVHKSYRNDKTLWYTTLEYTLPLLTRIKKGVKEKIGQEMKVRTMIMMHEGCEMNEKIKLKQKTKQNATKYKVNMTY